MPRIRLCICLPVYISIILSLGCFLSLDCRICLSTHLSSFFPVIYLCWYEVTCFGLFGFLVHVPIFEMTHSPTFMPINSRLSTDPSFDRSIDLSSHPCTLYLSIILLGLGIKILWKTEASKSRVSQHLGFFGVPGPGMYPCIHLPPVYLSIFPIFHLSISPSIRVHLSTHLSTYIPFLPFTI